MIRNVKNRIGYTIQFYINEFTESKLQSISNQINKTGSGVPLPAKI